MTYENVLYVLRNHDECSVVTLPSERELNKLKKVLKCDLVIKPTKIFDTGYVITKIKGGELNVGN